WPLRVVQPDRSLLSDQIIEELAKRAEQYPDGVAGKIPPDLSEGTWLNSDARSLNDFRGKFVLLDFWFIGCGPCERDMPTIKLLHQKFFDQGFSVVSIHKDGQSPQTVQKFANEKGMNYPIVVDTVDGVISKQYKPLGVYFYPMYMLLDPDGRIIHSDATSTGEHSLRMEKIELIYRELRERAPRP
ncbi:MAG: TlpA disulfide reductase family protein, partial [Aureliella sp.]